MQNLGKLEIQNLLDSQLINRLEEMAEAAYPELLQNANATDEKRRIAENALWEQAIKTRAQHKLGLEWEELSSATVLDFKRAYFVMGLMTASDFTDRLLEAIKTRPDDVLD